MGASEVEVGGLDDCNAHSGFNATKGDRVGALPFFTE